MIYESGTDFMLSHEKQDMNFAHYYNDNLF